jgi:hypothetical protein
MFMLQRPKGNKYWGQGGVDPHTSQSATGTLDCVAMPLSVPYSTLVFLAKGMSTKITHDTLSTHTILVSEGSCLISKNNKYMRIYAEDANTTYPCACNSHFAYRWCGVAGWRTTGSREDRDKRTRGDKIGSALADPKIT